MILGTPGTEQYRIRLGFLFLMLGLFLVFWAWGSWIYRASVPTQAQAMAHAQAANGIEGDDGIPTRDRLEVTRAMWLFLLVGAGLVLLVIFGTYVIVRAMRRYRAVLEADESSGDAGTDAWLLHRLPPDEERQSDDER